MLMMLELLHIYWAFISVFKYKSCRLIADLFDVHLFDKNKSEVTNRILLSYSASFVLDLW